MNCGNYLVLRLTNKAPAATRGYRAPGENYQLVSILLVLSTFCEKLTLNNTIMSLNERLPQYQCHLRKRHDRTKIESVSQI